MCLVKVTLELAFPLLDYLLVKGARLREKSVGLHRDLQARGRGQETSRAGGQEAAGAGAAAGAGGAEEAGGGAAGGGEVGGGTP